MILACLVSIYLLPGCDSGFDELNTNKTGLYSVNPVYLLNSAELRTSFPEQTLVYEVAIVQQMVATNGGVTAGGNSKEDNRNVTQVLWQRYYREVMKNLIDIIESTKNDPAKSNIYNMARIWRAYTIMVLTDTYGDVPYTNAGLGHLEQEVAPAYDTQEEIYNSILEELGDASAKLDATKTIETSEFVYGGNIARWKKLGYSLMLRAAMRLSEVDPVKAEEYVQVAVAGGVMESNADNCVIRHTSSFQNSVGGWLTGTEAATFYLAKPFVDFLKVNNDPRLASIAVRYPAAKSGGEQTSDVATRDTTKQLGMPMGHNNSTISGYIAAYNDSVLAADPTSKDTITSRFAFSQVDRTRMGKNTAPMFLVTYAQTSLLLAEAAHRNWITDDAAELFENGIRAHMQQMAEYDAGSAISSTDIDTYISNHPLEAGKEIEQINTQYWVASFLNGPEAFANYRRTGYPNLPVYTHPEKRITGDFINRLTYPNSEFSVNAENVNAAIAKQGPDDLETLVWWDKP